MSNEWVKWVNERNFQAIKLSDTATSHSPPVERGLSFVSTFPFVNRQQLHTLNGKSFTYLCITTWINEWPVKNGFYCANCLPNVILFHFSSLCVVCWLLLLLLLKPTNHFVRISFGNESNKSVMLHLQFHSWANEEVAGKYFDLNKKMEKQLFIHANVCCECMVTMGRGRNTTKLQNNIYNNIKLGAYTHKTV